MFLTRILFIVLLAKSTSVCVPCRRSDSIRFQKDGIRTQLSRCTVALDCGNFGGGSWGLKRFIPATFPVGKCLLGRDLDAIEQRSVTRKKAPRREPSAIVRQSQASAAAGGNPKNPRRPREGFAPHKPSVACGSSCVRVPSSLDHRNAFYKGRIK